MMKKQNWLTVWAAAGLALGIGASMAFGGELAMWDSNNSTPTNASFAPTQFMTDMLAVTNLHRGQGLTTGGSPAGGTFAAYGYDKTGYQAAMDGGDYWETCLNPQGNLLSLETMTYSFGGPVSGPKSWQWAAKVGSNTGSADSWTLLGTVVTKSAAGYLMNTVNLGDIPLTDQPVWFRLVSWDGGTAATAWGNFGQKTNVLVFAGTVESVTGAPMVRFTPAVGMVDEGKTLEMAVAVMPAGSGVSAWSVDPTPAGACSLSGGVFTFTPAAEDVQQMRFTLSVTATNAQGTTTGEAAVIVSEAVPAGTLTMTFDNERQTTWSGAASVEIPAGSGLEWSMDKCMIGEDAEKDKVYGGTGRALRFAYDEECVFASKGKILDFGTQTGDIQTNGIAEIRFWYGVYGEDAGEESAHPVRPPIVTELSDDGKYWVEVDRVSSAGSEEEMQERRITVGVETPVYFRIRIEGVSGSSRVDVDQVRIVPKVTEKNAYVKGLLQYNVTPGDDLTGKNDDWDGDGASNNREVSLRHTNPYDKNSK